MTNCPHSSLPDYITKSPDDGTVVCLACRVDALRIVHGCFDPPDSPEFHTDCPIHPSTEDQ